MSCLVKKADTTNAGTRLSKFIFKGEAVSVFLEPYVDVVVPVPLLALAAVHHVHVHDLQLLGSFGRVRIHRTPPC